MTLPVYLPVSLTGLTLFPAVGPNPTICSYNTALPFSCDLSPSLACDNCFEEQDLPLFF